jgi:hypothetical protein
LVVGRYSPLIPRTAAAIPAPASTFLEIEARPRDPTVADASDDHSGHRKLRSVAALPREAPLAPGEFAVVGLADELGGEVRNAAEHVRPVLPHLVRPDECAVWVGGLLAAVVGVEALDQAIGAAAVEGVERRAAISRDQAQS